MCLLLIGLTASVVRARAADDQNSSADAATSALPSLPAYLRQITDWGGLRSRLEQDGIKFTFTYYGDAFANPIGGAQQGAGYDGRFGTIIDVDLEKLVGWSGTTVHTSIHQVHGTQYSATMLDNLMTVSGIEAPPSVRLFNLWIEQAVGNWNVRVGQFTAAQEFFVSQNANLFVNSTFGWPVLASEDLQSGGPAYPEATPGIRVQYALNDQWTLRAAVFNGDPAGPGPGNPVDRDPYGLAFRVNDPPYIIAELAYAYGQQQRQTNPHQEGSPRALGPPTLSHSDLPGAIIIGGSVHTGLFADQRLNQQGGLLGIGGGQPLQHPGDFALYGVIDQMLWRVSPKDDRSLSFFVRAMAAPSDRNLIDIYADAGLTFKGLFAARPNDTAGLAVAFGRISCQAAAATQDVAIATGMPVPSRDFEAAIEATYQWQLDDNWFVQPNLQYINHPGGHSANPLQPTSAIPNALVFGTRTVLRF